MKKKLYLKPAIKVAGFVTHWFRATSPGWSRDGNPRNEVEQEDDVNEDDFDPIGGGYGGFLDLD